MTPRFACAAVSATVAAFTASSVLSAVGTPGTWELYPLQGSNYTTSIQQPVNADGSSTFKSNGKAVIPIKFGLSIAPGPVVFQSIGSDGTDPDESTTNDYSYLSFTPASTLLFSQLTTLSAVYSFTNGDCHGGALRWSVRTSDTQSVFIYYGMPPQFGNGGVNGCTPTSTGGASQTGINMLSLTDARFDLLAYGGPFYGTYADALALVGNLPIIRASLVLDGGWGGDQQLTLTNAVVNDNVFTPASGPGVPTCTLPEAKIQVTKVSGVSPGAINEPVTIQPNDNDGFFRVVDCKYMYNLATGSLSGAGGYQVQAIVNGSPAAGPATFQLK